jgi:flotillin
MIAAAAQIPLILGLILLFSVLAIFQALKNLLYICGPNEVLIFAGGKSTVGNRQVGYRIVKGGMSLRRPLVERVERMDLTNMTVEVNVVGAYSRGGIPLAVQGVANLKVAGHQPLLHNALVRFTGRSRGEIIAIAKNILEGNLRGVLSQLTPEEVNEDKLAFSEKLIDGAESDLGKIGLVLDQLKIQNVADDVGYLDSIGRIQSADLQKRARVAEANAKANALKRDAENRMNARVAEAEAQIKISTAQTKRRIADALTGREAVIAEQVGQVKAAIAKATAELEVQQARVEQVRLRLAADIIAPAEAGMKSNKAEAKASAAKIYEDGRATAAVLDEMITTWQAGGDAARDIFLMQKLQVVMASLVNTIQNVQVDHLTILPGANGRVTDTVRLVEELKAGVGVDLPELLKAFANKGSGSAPLIIE